MEKVVQELTKETFQQKVSEGTVVVDFWAEWCMPCKQLGPVFEELSKEIEGMTFYKLDVQNNQETAGQYGVMSIPCLIIFKDGKEVDRIVGALPKEQLKDKLQGHV